MDEESAVGPVEALIAWKPHFAIVVSPNAKLPGPSKARKMLAEAKIPTVSISDGPAAKAFYKKDDEGKKKLVNEHADAQFYFNKIETAKFFAANILPEVYGIAKSIESEDKSPMDAVL